MKELQIGNKTARVPVIQGGMGVGVSRSRLAGAVAAQGGIGIISTAQIGYDEEGFEKDQNGCNLRAIKKHIRRAKEMAKGGLVGVNIMVALGQYEDHVRASVEAGADVIISGAGLPANLPKLTEGSETKIAPIVSSEKAASVLLKRWDKKYNTTADFIVIEGPEAGGHLGFSPDQLANLNGSEYDKEILRIIAVIREFEEKFGHKIPVIVAGGIFSKEDVAHAMSLGADGVQVASRFVVTEECDASEAYKQAYINASKEDVVITQSPVGMPGRVLQNPFLEQVQKGRIPVKKCYGCIARCKPAEIPYCITQALVDAVKGDVDNGLIFCGSNVGRINKMTTVEELMKELGEGFERSEAVGMPEEDSIPQAI